MCKVPQLDSEIERAEMDSEDQGQLRVQVEISPVTTVQMVEREHKPLFAAP